MAKISHFFDWVAGTVPSFFFGLFDSQNGIGEYG